MENYIEGTKINYKNVDKKELKINFNRFKRIASMFNIAVYQAEAIFNFEYPRFSYLSWLVNFFLLLVLTIISSSLYFLSTFLI